MVDPMTSSQVVSSPPCDFGVVSYRIHQLFWGYRIGDRWKHLTDSTESSVNRNTQCLYDSSFGITELEIEMSAYLVQMSSLH